MSLEQLNTVKPKFDRKEYNKSYSKLYYLNNKEKYKEYAQKPEAIERRKKRRATKKYKDHVKEYNARPEVKERKKKYRAKPESREKENLWKRKYRKKPEVQKKTKVYNKKYRDKNKKTLKEKNKQYRESPEYKKRQEFLSKCNKYLKLFKSNKVILTLEIIRESRDRTREQAKENAEKNPCLRSGKHTELICEDLGVSYEELRWFLRKNKLSISKLGIYERAPYLEEERKAKKRICDKKYREKEGNKEKASLYSKQYRIKNEETLKEKNKIYRKKNKEKIKGQRKKSYKKRIDKILAYQKKYSKENKDKIRKRTKAYYEKNKERLSMISKKKQKEYIEIYNKLPDKIITKEHNELADLVYKKLTLDIYNNLLLKKTDKKQREILYHNYLESVNWERLQAELNERLLGATDNPCKVGDKGIDGVKIVKVNGIETEIVTQIKKETISDKILKCLIGQRFDYYEKNNIKLPELFQLIIVCRKFYSPTIKMIKDIRHKKSLIIYPFSWQNLVSIDSQDITLEEVSKYIK